MDPEQLWTIGRHTISLSHLDKLFFPKSGITKGDVVEYYEKIAPFFLPHVKDHFIVMHRFPDGISAEGFYHKEVPSYFPSWISRKTIPLKKGSSQTLVLVNKSADLVYLANQAVITFHSWLSRYTKPDVPDKIVFDLDPSKGCDLELLQFSARSLKKALEKHDLVPYLMTTGSRGYHVVCPIKPVKDFASIRDFAKALACELADEYPDQLTTEMSKAKRGKRVFLDYLRNGYGQTSVAPYSLRAREGAPVATPLDWHELAASEPQKYTIKNIFRRLSRKGDPWKDFKRSRRTCRW